MIERQAAVQMKAQLESNGWKVYGYREDRSDMMTDYYCPSLWWGIAEKDGYVLLVDVYGTGDSGKKVTEKAFTPDPQKVQKLKTLIERGATDGEKQAAQTQLDKLYKREEENTIVKYEYPTFYNGNPKRCTWHVEKDGEIVAKGTGASDDTLNKGNYDDVEKAVSKLISRIEKRISDNKELVPVEKKEVTKVTKPVEIDISLDQVVKGETCLVIDKPLTGGVSKGYVYKLENITEGKNGNMYRFQRMNKKLNKVLNGTANPANFVYLSESNFNNLYNKGCFHFAKLEEVEEVTYKTVYVSKERQQKENLLNGTQEEEQPKQDKQVKEDNKEQPATKKQLFALHMASNKEVDTRGLDITKQQASELISRSKSGESIINELKEIAGFNVEEDEQDQGAEENKTPQSETVEDEKQTEEEKGLSNEEAKDLEKKYVYNNATTEEQETLEQYHLQLQEKAMTFKDSLKDYEALIDNDKVYHVLSIVNKDNGTVGQFNSELTGQELKKELLVNNILDIYTPLEKQEQEPQEQQATNDNNIDPNLLNEAQELEATYYINEDRNGLEISFSDKPSQELRELLKHSYGFKWSNNNSVWYSKQSEERLQFVKALCNQEEGERVSHEPTSYPHIDIDDLLSYSVSQDLQDREHESHWVMRKNKRDHTEEIRTLFKRYNDQVKDVLSHTENEKIIYYLKRDLQRFKKKYHTVYEKMLSNRASNPSWMVTGRANRDVRKHEKAMNRYDNLMHESIQLTEWIEKRIKKTKQDIRRDEEQQVKKAFESSNIDMVTFSTETREIPEFHNSKVKKRFYIHGDYAICKIWNKFRVYYKGKEIETPLKTTSKLTEAKRYVSYLVQKEGDQEKAG